ncbi:MAG: hypothetical protein DRN13_01915 [Thermoplasmata archaeon]|nr:MAG: hypothetical protein DRN13_01915 [Thermoplasmata archaeon]HDO69590.1 hypothetical protein [Thermoplasmatales archaeon]HEX17505.1 hypothetical protein [Thermoplasmatales archaeon]
MVDIGEIRESFRKFREEFSEDILDMNLEKRDVKAEEIKTKMVESEFFKSIREFAKERGWSVEDKDLTICAKRGDEVVEIDPVVFTSEKTAFIKPWIKVVDRLERLQSPED